MVLATTYGDDDRNIQCFQPPSVPRITSRLERENRDGDHASVK